MPDTIQNHTSIGQASRLSGESLDPRLSVHLDRIRVLLGNCTEPFLLAYGVYARNPRHQANFKNLLQVGCDAALHITGADAAALALQKDSLYIYRVTSGALTRAIDSAVTSERDFPAACTKSGQAFLSNRVSADPRVDPALHSHGTRALLAVPLMSGAQPVGFFELISFKESPFNVKHIVSSQFIATLLGQVIAELLGANKASPTACLSPNIPKHSPNAGSELPGEPIRIGQVLSARDHAESTASSDISNKAELASLESFSNRGSVATDNCGGHLAQSAVNLQSSGQRRRTPRSPVDCLAYVSLGEENGGILLDISDAGFSLQTALPIGAGASRRRCARFSGNGDVEAECKLVWEQGGLAGFSFCELSTDLHRRLLSWSAKNGIVITTSATEAPARFQPASSACAILDELQSMLVNSKLTKHVMQTNIRKTN